MSAWSSKKHKNIPKSNRLVCMVKKKVHKKTSLCTWEKTRNFVFWKIILSKSVTEGKPNFNILAGKPCLFSVWALKGKSRFYKFNLKSFRLSFIIMKPYLYTLFILFIFCLRGRFPFLFWDFLVCCTMILQHIRIILEEHLIRTRELCLRSLVRY